MCGRITLRVPMSVLMRDFEFQGSSSVELRARYNVAPTQNVAAVVLREGQRQFEYMKWGLIPSWAKDTKIAYSTINARADTVATKPAFRSAYKSRRCLVLADGYYEWKAEGKAKLPYLYELNEGAPFAIAGLWETWRGPSGDDAPLTTCTMLTTDANELASQIHHRMPVILHPADYDHWLTPGSDVTDLLRPHETSGMTVRRVNPIVNKATNEGAQCVEAWE